MMLTGARIRKHIKHLCVIAVLYYMVVVHIQTSQEGRPEEVQME